MYLKLTNAELDLADQYQRWQMEKYGNVLVKTFGIAPANDDQRVIEDRRNREIEIETFNLNEQV